MSFDRDWTVAPGDTLRDWMEEQVISMGAAARLCKIDLADYEDIVNGTLPIDPDIAGKLQAATGITARFWLNYEAQYRADLEAGRRRFD